MDRELGLSLSEAAISVPLIIDLAASLALGFNIAIFLIVSEPVSPRLLLGLSCAIALSLPIIRYVYISLTAGVVAESVSGSRLSP